METSSSVLRLANWGKRFLAWLIDFFAIGILFTELLHQTVLLPRVLLPIPNLLVPTGNLVLIIYWTFAEGILGVSIGKYLFRLRTTTLSGDRPGLARAFLQSIGKSLLAPVDLLLGLAINRLNVRRQRLFNRLSGTIVVVAPVGTVKEPISYLREK